MPSKDELLADALAKDSRFVTAKAAILDVIREYKGKIDHIRHAEDPLKSSYANLLKALENERGAPLYYPYIGSGLGNGALVELANGSVKYDMIAGIGPHFFGHNSDIAAGATLDAALADILMQGNLQQNREALAFSSLLTKVSGLDHCFIATTGVMANENALKIAYQKRFPASRVLAFERCFTGRTLALSQVTDKAAYREGLPPTLSVDYLPFYDDSNPEESEKKTLQVLKSHLKRYPKQHAAMFLELIQGEGGCYPGTHSFFSKIAEVLKNEGIAIIADEVQTFGRTESLFAFQHFKLESYVDMVTIGKMSLACATLFKKEWCPRPGLLSQTFISSTNALIAGTRIIQTLIDGGFYGPDGKIARFFRSFASGFEEIRGRHPDKIRGPYGLGGMIAFTPLDGSIKNVINYLNRLYENGVIAFQTGADPLRARFLPPLGVLTEEDLDRVLEIVEKTLVESGS